MHAVGVAPWPAGAQMCCSPLIKPVAPVLPCTTRLRILVCPHHVPTYSHTSPHILSFSRERRNYHITCPLIPTCHHIFCHSAGRGGITTSYDNIIPTISPHIPFFLGLYFKVQNMIFFSNQPTVRWYTCTVQCIVVYIICIRTRFIVSSLRLDVVNSHIRPHCGRIWLHVVT